jgi:type III secretion protein C
LSDASASSLKINNAAATPNATKASDGQSTPDKATPKSGVSNVAIDKSTEATPKTSAKKSEKHNDRKSLNCSTIKSTIQDDYGIIVSPIQSSDDGIPWKDSNYYHFSKDQDLSELIKSFCSMQGIDIVVSEKVNDIVNGKFSNVAPKQFWHDMTQAYGLVWFFDGSILYVYKGNEIMSKVWKMSPDEMRSLAKVMEQLGFSSSNFSFRPMEKSGILVVSGPPKLMEVISDLSAKIIVERMTDVYDIKSFRLKNAWAYDMSFNYKGGTVTIPGVATMLQAILYNSPGAIGDTNIGMTTDKKNPHKATAVKDLTDNCNYFKPDDDKSKKDNKSNEKPAATENKNSGDSGIKNEKTWKDIFITYDSRLNAVIVKAKKQDMELLGNLIEQLDVSQQAIRIDVAIIDIRKGITEQLGTDLLSMQGHRLDVLFNPSNNKKSRASINGIFKNYTLTATLQALEEAGDAQTLARPSVLTVDNIAAVIDRSNTVYVQVAGKESQGLYDVTASTKLVVVPHIIPEEYDEGGNPKIKLMVEVSDGSVDKDPRFGATGTPSTSTSSINTEAVLYEGQSLFIGGYFHEQHDKADTGIPLLKDIPIIGNIFKNKMASNNVLERIYLITPKIVKIDEQAIKDYNRFFSDSNLSGEATLNSKEFNLLRKYKSKDYSITKEEKLDEKRTAEKEKRKLKIEQKKNLKKERKNKRIQAHKDRMEAKKQKALDRENAKKIANENTKESEPPSKKENVQAKPQNVSQKNRRNRKKVLEALRAQAKENRSKKKQKKEAKEEKNEKNKKSAHEKIVKNSKTSENEKNQSDIKRPKRRYRR